MKEVVLGSFCFLKEMDITEVSILHHVGIMLMGIWLLSAFNWCHPVAYFVALIYLYLVSEGHSCQFATFGDSVTAFPFVLDFGSFFVFLIG